jgi:putative membrane protein insertion efficiency factor
MNDLPPLPSGLVARLMLGLIRAYQRLISPFLAPACRFHPSCSRYTAECICLHGAARGSYLGMRRILRCHPFNPGGYDPPPLPDSVRQRDELPTQKPDRSLH